MKKTFTPANWPCVVISILCSLLFSPTVYAQVVLTKGMSHYSQDFNTFPVSGSGIWESETFYFPGWKLHRTVQATTSLLTGSGTSNAGGLYSFGLAGSSDRALGAISSGSTTVGQFAWGLLIQNNTGSAINTLHVSFTGEQWRSASKAAGIQGTTFWYSHSNESPAFNLSPLSDNNWTNVPDLNFYSPVYFSDPGALEGNLPRNKRYLTATFQVNIPDGHYFMLRWKDLNDLNDDHGLAIDDFTLTWDTGKYTGPTVMPVELIFFKSSIVANGVKLEWATATERNSSHFNIERSADGKIYETIGSLASKGNSSIKINYTFLDEEPLFGTSYYRLKQVDLDDSYEYSNMVTVKKSGPGAVSVYPTISSGDLQIKLPSSPIGTTISVYDKLGRVILSKDIPAQVVHYKLNIRPLEPGHYFLLIPGAKSEKQVFRFIKK